jgi:hypothetical protein
MKISEDTRRVITYLENSSEQGLAVPELTSRILESAATYSLIEDLNSIIFSSAAVVNIQRALKTALEDKTILKNALTEESDKIAITARKILGVAGEDTEIPPKEILELAHDLNILKSVQKKLNR